jgi:virulence-associated protein VapD
MYAVAFDLVVADVRRHHPKADPSAAYRDIYEVLVNRHGFEWKQGSPVCTP